MSIKAKLLIAKLLISFAAIFVVTGTLIEVNFSKIYDPIDDVKVVAEANENDITVSTLSSEDDIKIINEVIEASTIMEIILPKDDEKSNKENSVISSPTARETNLKLRLAIESLYGVNIRFGDETRGYGVGGMSTTALVDDNISQIALSNLNKELSLYPSNFFKEITDNGYPITFYLVQRFSKADVTGVTDSSNKNIIVSIATDYDFSDTLHHEIYHYIEKYLVKSGVNFTSWNSLNPKGFLYGNFNSKYVYKSEGETNPFFVNTYAQTNSSEDRASTFEYMMKKKKEDCFDNDSVVWIKARTICEQMEYFLENVSPNTVEYWERYIY